MWTVQALQCADANGRGTGRWRLTATSDEGGGGPTGDTSHDHASAEEANACERCDEYCSSITGFPSRRRRAEDAERREREEFDRLKAKYPDAK